MSGESFSDMTGLTFADFPEATNGHEVKPEPAAGPNPAIDAAFHAERELRAMCPHCHSVGTGTFEELQLHMDECRATD